jgi:hypothetical protein
MGNKLLKGASALAILTGSIFRVLEALEHTEFIAKYVPQSISNSLIVAGLILLLALVVRDRKEQENGPPPAQDTEQTNQNRNQQKKPMAQPDPVVKAPCPNLKYVSCRITGITVEYQRGGYEPAFRCFIESADAKVTRVAVATFRNAHFRR